MKMTSLDTYLIEERVNLRTAVVSLIMGSLGILLLYLSSNGAFWETHKNWQIVLRNIGSLIFATTIIKLIWEIWEKRAFLDEILAKMKISKDIESSGIIGVAQSFHHDINWKSHFSTVKELDIFVTYARTWRNTYKSDFKEVIKRKDTKIRVFLPDPEDEQVIKELAKRFNRSEKAIDNLIKEAAEYFKKLCPSKNNQGTKIEILFLPVVPVFSFYRFDKIAIFTLLSHRRNRVEIPAFVCRKGGSLYNYIYKELEAMIKMARPAEGM